MAHHLKYSCFLLAILLGGTMATAQTVRINTSGPPLPQLPAGMSSDLQQQILKSVEQTLNEYAEAATLMDPDANKVTGESIDRFRSLFNAVARIPKDFLEFVPEELYSLSSYCDEVFQRLEYRGLQLQVNSAHLLSIEDDPSGFYIVKVDLEKTLFNYLSERGGHKAQLAGRRFKQKFYFDVPKQDLSIAKIASIRGETRPPAADYARYLGPSLSLYLPLANAQASTFWTENHAANSTLSVNGGFSFSAGFDFMTNRVMPRQSPSKKLFVSAGLHFSFLSVTTQLEEFSINRREAEASNDTGTLAYERSVNGLNAKEKLNISSLTVPIGLAFQLKSSRKWDGFLALRFLPAFTLFSSGSLSGEGSYSASLEDANWDSSLPNAVNPAHLDDPNKFGPFQIGNRALTGTPKPDFSSFTLAAQLSPSAYIHLSDLNSNWSLLLGLDLTYHFRSPVEHQDTETDILLYPDNYETSILQHYNTGLSLLAVGFRVGLQHRLITKP